MSKADTWTLTSDGILDFSKKKKIIIMIIIVGRCEGLLDS